MSTFLKYSHFIWHSIGKPIIVLASLSLLLSCTNVTRIDSAKADASLGIIKNGSITSRELTERLGAPYKSFEEGRVAIYLLDDSNGGFDKSFDRDIAPYRLVLVFDSNEVLVKHSIERVK